jgi:hypothetical protein
MRKLAVIVVFASLSISGCNAARLQKTGDAMVRVERAGSGIVKEVDAFAVEQEENCRAQNLQTQDERAECVAVALKAVEVTEAATQALKAALVTFWNLYPVLEAKVVNKERLSADDIGELIAMADRVYAEYAKLLEVIKEIRAARKTEPAGDQASLDVIELEAQVAEVRGAVARLGAM